MDISYKEIYTMNKGKARRQIISTYLTLGNVSEGQASWHTSRNVVRKGVKKFERRGEPAAKK